MALYFLEYDLRKQRNYKALYDKLAEFDAVRILESLWCFKREQTNAKGLCQYFTQFLDGDDGIIVSEVVDWASWNVQGDPNSLK
ncbi:hypothetical protein F8N49_23235 [Pseudomonas sp. GXM4]|jgi:hypothetical protein|uniref:hypothetical protein n=1 Tax=Pseudomonas sp. GXM4 TaxID=2651867 RepID=UPI00124DA0CD|nr:hypothetical protein [Pseudomonas sp. GXM4]KAB2518032.1 hypothetical protein F8N49_23235 [Pseudomonas sp. GXM4]